MRREGLVTSEGPGDIFSLAFQWEVPVRLFLKYILSQYVKKKKKNVRGHGDVPTPILVSVLNLIPVSSTHKNTWADTTVILSYIIYSSTLQVNKHKNVHSLETFTKTKNKQVVLGE